MDGRPNGIRKAPFFRSSGVVRTVPKLSATFATFSDGPAENKMTTSDNLVEKINEVTADYFPGVFLTVILTL